MNAADFSTIVIATKNGLPVRLGDVTRVIDSVETTTTASWYDGTRAIILAVQRQPDANTVDVVDRVKAMLPSFSEQLPAAAGIKLLNDRSTSIRSAVSDVEFTLGLTIALVVLVILLFLRNFWATFIPSITVPLALTGSAAAMYLLNFSLDNLSLMALTIAVGFVVDDAIVVVENIYRHIEEGESPLQAAIKGSSEIGFTVLSISCSLVAVFIPLLLMGGIIGRLFSEFALKVTASIAVSALVSLTLAPMMCARFMRKQSHEHGRLYRTIESGFEAIASFYRRTLDIALRHQRVTIGVFFATLALTVFMAVEIPKGFFPIQDTGVISAFIEAAQDTSPEEMMRLMKKAGAVVLNDPDVAGLGTFTGSSGGAQTANTGRGFIVLKPRDERKLTSSQIIDRLRPQLAKVEGVNMYLQPTQDITVGGRIARASFQYTLQDSNLAELNEWSNKMLDKMRTLPEITDVGSDLLSNAPQLKISINRDQASRFGISPQLIDDTLNDAFGQRQITQYYTQLKTYFVILEILPALQKDLATLNRLYVKSPLSGGAVPLSSLVDVDSGKVGPLSVSHQGQFPAATLTFNLRPGVALGEAVDAINNAAREIQLPSSVLPTFQGNAQAFQDSLSSAPILIAAALVVVYIILGMLYESFILPLTILSTLPSAGVGALLALRAGGMDLSVIGIIGIILLIGIVKKNGIMLVDFAINAERERDMAPLDAIREACLLRFRPILMTTAAAMLAGIPLALGHGTGSELRQPLGYAMVGGLAFSQVLTLYTTPVVYLYLDRFQRWLDRRKGDREPADEGLHQVAAE
jgi:HAE1 family hydrophobic/amphiphilic exporter-1